jgi:hypothetical protein
MGQDEFLRKKTGDEKSHARIPKQKCFFSPSNT